MKESWYIQCSFSSQWSNMHVIVPFVCFNITCEQVVLRNKVLYSFSAYRPCSTSTIWAGNEGDKSNLHQLQSHMAVPRCRQCSAKVDGKVCHQCIKEARSRIVSTMLWPECCHYWFSTRWGPCTRGAANNLWHTANKPWKGAHSSTHITRYSSLSFRFKLHHNPIGIP